MGSVVIKADIERVAGGAEFVCSVSDTGIGINEDQQDGIFKLFTQGEFSYTKKIAGTGLGLTLVKRLLDIMHGSIGFHSSPGEGSSFCFRLPVKMEAVLDTDTPGTDTPDKKLEILVIEDNEINRITLEQMLAALGHNAAAAETAAEALAIIAGKHFDLILLDIQLPDMDGITAFSSIRKLSEAPVVAITGFAAADHRMRILDSGINGFLAKPFTMNELKNTVRDFS
jgi:two-component system, sensor histidine kinase